MHAVPDAVSTGTKRPDRTATAEAALDFVVAEALAVQVLLQQAVMALGGRFHQAQTGSLGLRLQVGRDRFLLLRRRRCGRSC